MKVKLVTTMACPSRSVGSASYCQSKGHEFDPRVDRKISLTV